MLRKFLVCTAITLAVAGTSVAQKVLDTKEEVKELKSEAKDGWITNGGLGLDFTSLMLSNPRPGSGDSRVGFGGLVSYIANYKKRNFIWDTKAGLQLSVIKNGSDPYTKAIDAMQVTTRMGRRSIFDDKLYWSVLGDFQTQLLPTYAKNLLQENVNNVRNPLSSNFLAPGTVKIALGAIYRLDDHLSLMYAPAAYKGIIVRDSILAASGFFFKPEVVNGNRKMIDHQLGSEIRADYSNKFLNGKLSYVGTLDLYSNYFRDFQNVDVEVYHTLDYLIWKNLSLNLKSDWFYDHDLLVYKGGDVNRLGRDLFMRNAIFLKYSQVF
ncbi:MAG: hypothetical protein RIS64_515 [Bacteroidota bacterium]|jgi:hypothetical protein